MNAKVFDILNYEFMRRAFIVAGLLSIILPCIGLSILLKRLSTMGDTLAHASLAGVSFGLMVGIDPVIGSIAACVIAGLNIEYVRNKLKAYQEISTVIVMAGAIGLAGIFSSFTGASNSVSSYLFGSIVTISDTEFYLAIAMSALVLLVYWAIYDKLYISVFDPESAKIFGIKANRLNFVFTFLAAVAISVSAKTIGSLIVSSMLVIPIITAMQFTKTYKQTLFTAIGLSVFYMYAGLVLSYVFNLKPGSVIVLISVLFLILAMTFKRSKA